MAFKYGLITIKNHLIYYLMIIITYITVLILSQVPLFDVKKYYDIVEGYTILDKILILLNVDMHQRALQVYSFSIVFHFIIYGFYSRRVAKPHKLSILIIYAVLLYCTVPVFW